MINQPSIDISVRWKLLGAFAGTFLFPVVMFLCEVPLWIIILIGFPVACGLALYSAWRILSTVERISVVVDRLNRRTDTPKPHAGTYKDELTDLVHGFDHLLDHIETSIPSLSAPPAEMDSEADVSQTQYTYRSYQGSLATGDPVSGLAAILPRRVEEDLLRVAQVAGDQAVALFTDMVAIAREQLADLRDDPNVEEDQRGIIDFQVLLLEDPAFTTGMRSCFDDGLSLGEALSKTFGVISGKLESSQNPYIVARVPDCLDLKHRLLDILFHHTNPGLANLYAGLAGKIVLCHQIYPSDVITLRNANVLGIISAVGTASSHAEIFLQSFNLPSVSNIAGLPIERLKNHTLLLDTRHKRIVVSPTTRELESVKEHRLTETLHVIAEPVTLLSGEPMRVDATINNIEVEAKQAEEFGADGVGLFRSEMSYIGRIDLPLEDDLYREYKALIDRFQGKPVILRMLDLGSDKLAMFQGAPHEENPCMGNRSMRLLLSEPAIFRTQLRAMLRAATPQTSIIYPMIGGWSELRQIEKRFAQVQSQLAEEGVPHCASLRTGIMVEVPGLVERFEDFVQHFDDFNIGSNDLTQYTLAADRNNEAVAEYYRFHHPAILSMIAKVCRLGAAHGKVIRICGEMSSNPDLLPLLVGLGATAYSVPYRHVPIVKANLSRLRLDDCTQLAEAALQCETPLDIERLFTRFRQDVQYHAQRTTTLRRSDYRHDAP